MTINKLHQSMILHGHTMHTLVFCMMDDNRCFLAANRIKSLENALLAVKYGARNVLHSPQFPTPFALRPLDSLVSRCPRP